MPVNTAPDIDRQAADHLLTTTRSVRKRIDFDRAVPSELLQECLEIAIQAPTGSNSQGYHFLVVEDVDKKQAIANLYRRAFGKYADVPQVPHFEPGDPRAKQMGGVLRSAAYLNERLHEVPVMLIACVEGRWEEFSVFHQAAAYGSIFPAIWSLVLALRARGVGAAVTTMHLMYEQEAAELLGIPDDITQAALLPIGYYKGETFRRADRIPARDRTYWGDWGETR